MDWRCDLDPPLDEWKETSRAPDIVVNLNGTYDNLRRAMGLENESIATVPLGTEWNEWQDQWSGNPRSNTTQNGRYSHYNNKQRCCSD